MEIALQAPYRLPRQARAATMRPVSTNELTDAELIIRTGDGDRGAFEVLYQRYARPVFGLALRRLGDRGRAEDAVQETFASVWRAARSYKPERGPGGPWLYAVARNAITDRSRARTEPAVEAPDQESHEAGPADRAEASWTTWRVHRALEELSVNERSVIELAYWGGLSQSEVDEYLGIPLGTFYPGTQWAIARSA